MPMCPSFQSLSPISFSRLKRFTFIIDAYIIAYTAKPKSLYWSAGPTIEYTIYAKVKKKLTHTHTRHNSRKKNAKVKMLLFLFSSTDKHKFIVLLNAVDVEMKYYDLLSVACFNCCGRVFLYSSYCALLLHSKERDRVNVGFFFLLFSPNFRFVVFVILFSLCVVVAVYSFFAIVYSLGHSAHATYFVNMYVLFIEFFRDQMIIPCFSWTFFHSILVLICFHDPLTHTVLWK